MNKKTFLRPARVFSETLKRKIVKDIEDGKGSVTGVSREYGVCIQTVYRWINKYSRHLQSSKRIVMEMKSESYNSKALEKRILELEAALGRKQMEIDLLNQMLKLGSEQLGVDLKKNFSSPLFNTSELPKDNTPTK